MGNIRSVLGFLFADHFHLSRGSTKLQAATAYELPLVSFPGVVWAKFFSPHGFPGFWDAIQNGVKKCIV